MNELGEKSMSSVERWRDESLTSEEILSELSQEVHKAEHIRHTEAEKKDAGDYEAVYTVLEEPVSVDAFMARERIVREAGTIGDEETYLSNRDLGRFVAGELGRARIEMVNLNAALNNSSSRELWEEKGAEVITRLEQFYDHVGVYEGNVPDIDVDGKAMYWKGELGQDAMSLYTKLGEPRKAEELGSELIDRIGRIDYEGDEKWAAESALAVILCRYGLVLEDRAQGVENLSKGLEKMHEVHGQKPNEARLRALVDMAETFARDHGGADGADALAVRAGEIKAMLDSN